MPIRVHTGSGLGVLKQPFGGSWSGPITDGNLRLKWGGSSWTYPAFARVKVSDGGITNGGFGANPQWVDTGYRGYPVKPSTPWVTAWDYNTMSISWNAGSGGAAVSQWHVVRTNEGGGWINNDYVPVSQNYFSYGVNWNTRYQHYIEAVSSSGLVSGFSSPLRTYIGTPSQYYETTETGTRAWDGYTDVGDYGIKDNIVGPAVPSSVVVQTIQFDLGCPWGVLSPYGNREIYWVANGVQQGLEYWGGSEIHTNQDVGDYWGNGQGSGFVCRGAGWTIYPGGQSRVWGSLWVHGYEQYQYQQGHWTNAVGNGYW